MKQKVKSENRRALPLFLVIVGCSLVLGVLFGMAAVKSDGADWKTVFTAALTWFFAHCSSWLLLALTVSMLVVGLASLSRARKQIAALEQTEDGDAAPADHTLSAGINYMSLAQIVGFFLFAAVMCGVPEMGLVSFLVGLVSFIALLVVVMVMTQRLVDLAKRLYPEKRGSVYDVKFQKKWLDSCDEAEKAVIAQAAFSAYSATNTVCLLLWLAFVLGHMLFDTGLLPIFAVSLIWFVSFAAYCSKAAKLEKSGIR